MSLYQGYEVEVSQSQLSKILPALGEPVCLLGGWAVYITVNKNFAASQGRNFQGSRDIDLGFHVDSSWTGGELKESLFGRAIERIEEVGFEPVGFRFMKCFHTETRRELSADEARRTNQAFIFNMYIDPLVDKIHPDLKKLFGFVPIDEPLLAEVFSSKKSSPVREFGSKVILPKPSVLLAMKLNSVSKRDKEQKRLKDIIDIYGLLWYSDEKPETIREELLSTLKREKITSVVSSFREEELAAVARNLGVEKSEVANVMAELRR